MKGELMIFVVSIFLVIGISFVIYNIQDSGVKLTGFAVLNDSSDLEVANETMNESINITRELALSGLNESELIMEEMIKNNFSIVYMNDTLLEARRVFEQAEFAEILRGEVNATEDEKKKARQTLDVVDLEKITYADVLIHTDEINRRRYEAFILFDSIDAVRISIKDFYGDDLGAQELSEAFILSNDAETAFYEDRYKDAEELLIKSKEELELEKSQSTTFNTIRSNAKNFIQRNWHFILIFLIALGVIGFFSYKKINKKLLKKKIKKMTAESKVLTNLIKKTEIEAFKKETISEFIYNIRVKKYRERLQEIKERLPVLEKKLDKLNKMKHDHKK